MCFYFSKLQQKHLFASCESHDQQPNVTSGRKYEEVDRKCIEDEATSRFNDVFHEQTYLHVTLIVSLI